MTTPRWLRLGPLLVRLRAPAWLLPWPWPALCSPRPSAGVRWRLDLDISLASSPGADGPVARSQEGYLGPGFELRPRGAAYEAHVASPVGCMGALAAALIDQASEHGQFALLHAALLLVDGRGVLALGPSGSGKSTLAARHPEQALGANAALVWERRGEFRAFPLPLTGHGDASIRPGTTSVHEGWWLGSGGGSAAARWLGAAATALGVAPPVGLLLRLASTTPLHEGPHPQPLSGNTGEGSLGLPVTASLASPPRPR